MQDVTVGTTDDISIHALREEGDTSLITSFFRPSRFLSTPSARRATPLLADVMSFVVFLSTPSARRATFAGLSTF